MTFWRPLWGRLTAPAADLKNPVDREQARLLSSTLWVLLLTTGVLFLVRLGSHGLQPDLDLVARLGIIFFALIASFFSHRGHVRLISLLGVILGSLVIFYAALVGGGLPGLSTLNYLILLIVFGSLFLPFWLNTLIFILQLAGILACIWFEPALTLADLVLGPFGFHLTLGVVALVMTHYRNALENIRKAEITLNEKRFRGIFETSPIGIRLYDAGGNFQSANPTCLNNFSFLPGATPQPLNLFVDPMVSAETQACLCAGETARFVNKFDPRQVKPRPGFTNAGEVRYQDVSITPLREAGQIQGYLMQLVDISEQKRVDEIVRARRNSLLLISDNLPAMIAHIDADQRYLFANQPYAEFFKTSPKTIIGRALSEVLGAEVLEHFETYFARVLRGERVEFEIILKDTKGRERIVQTIFVPESSASGQVGAYFAMLLDITERKRAEASLAHKAAQLELLSYTGQNLSAITSISEVLHRAVELVRQSFNYHRVSIFLVDEDTQDLVMMTKSGEFSDEFPGEFRIQPNVGMTGWVVKHRKTRFANDVTKDRFYINPFPEGVPTWAELCAPIVVESQVIGVLDVQSPEMDAFDESDILVMETVAEQVAVSIQNARLHTAAQHELAKRERAEHLLQTALQEKEVLLKEIHHRVKNNLQVIASLLNLRAEKLDDPRAIQAFQDCQNSISAIASIHKSLYESSNQTSINANEYLRNLFERLKNSFYEQAGGILHTVSIEPVPFDFDTAIPCGLILNELLTNVYKYAFPPEAAQPETCAVNVTLFEKEAQVFLSVCDNGVGFPPDFENRKSQALGLQLVGLLVKQLKGSLAVNGKAGVVVEISFPSPRIKSGGPHAGSPDSGR
jgi:PAS domain S-box-containing protein